jgi:histidinol-phosphate aminotransferase
MKMENVFITGSSKGIGLAIGKYLSSKNYNVIYNGRSENKFNNPLPNYIQSDVNSPDLLKTVKTMYSKIDILINNAGVLMDDDSENIEEEIQTNLISCANFCKQAEKLGIKKVINISSGSVVNCPDDISMYGWTKYALEGLTKFLSKKGTCSFTNLRIDVSLKTNMTENYFKEHSQNGIELKNVDNVLPLAFMICKMAKEECNGKTFSLQRFMESPKLEKLFQHNSILSKQLYVSGGEITGRESFGNNYNKCMGDNPHGKPYPTDFFTENVTTQLSKKFDIKKEQVLLVNGGISTSVDLISKIFIREGDRILSLGIMFPPLMSSFINMGGTIDFSQVVVEPPKQISTSESKFQASIYLNFEDIDAKLANYHYKIVYITNPFYLTGKVLNKEEFNDIVTRIPKNVTIVVDECYIEFTRNKHISSCVDIIQRECYKDHNIIGLRTFSKFYGLGDIRAGYIVSNQHIIELLSYNIPWKNMPENSLKLIEQRLEDKIFLEESYNHNNNSRKYVQNELEKIGLNYIPSYSNTICIQLPNEMSLKDFCKMCKDDCKIALPTESLIEGTFIYQFGKEQFNKKLIKLLRRLS